MPITEETPSTTSCRRSSGGLVSGRFASMLVPSAVHETMTVPAADLIVSSGGTADSAYRRHGEYATSATVWLREGTVRLLRFAASADSLRVQVRELAGLPARLRPQGYGGQASPVSWLASRSSSEG